ncbi:hypothetical protein [uncultured Marixanthomonas sp.]|uniref:hypothetical protein n=1 Tax=uncultured Marixanthomonas sp. TaxID=757245 RepID=UPI0030DA166D
MKIITNFTNTRKERTKIHWGNVIAGTMTILGFLIVLYFLGVGTGITNKGTELNPLVLTDTFIWL